MSVTDRWLGRQREHRPSPPYPYLVFSSTSASILMPPSTFRIEALARNSRMARETVQDDHALGLPSSFDPDGQVSPSCTPSGS
jgi:hypothetical protein